jgi:hypothetical protein
MSYLKHALPRLAVGRRGDRPARVDVRVTLNRPAFDGGAHVRAFVEDTSGREGRFRRAAPSPRLKLRIADCVNEVHLEFSVDSLEERENSLHKIATLIAALERFRVGLKAEADLRARRESGVPTTEGGIKCRS